TAFWRTDGQLHRPTTLGSHRPADPAHLRGGQQALHQSLSRRLARPDLGAEHPDQPAVSGLQASSFRTQPNYVANFRLRTLATNGCRFVEMTRCDNANAIRFLREKAIHEPRRRPAYGGKAR